jgi:hypothetical protein
VSTALGAVQLAEAVVAVKTISDTKFDVKLKQFWVLMEKGKAELAKFSVFEPYYPACHWLWDNYSISIAFDRNLANSS